MFEIWVLEIMIAAVVRLVVLVVLALHIFHDRGKFLKSVIQRNIRYNDITLFQTFLAVFLGAVGDWSFSIQGRCGSRVQYGGRV